MVLAVGGKTIAQRCKYARFQRRHHALAQGRGHAITEQIERLRQVMGGIGSEQVDLKAMVLQIAQLVVVRRPGPGGLIHQCAQRPRNRWQKAALAFNALSNGQRIEPGLAGVHHFFAIRAQASAAVLQIGRLVPGRKVLRQQLLGNAPEIRSTLHHRGRTPGRAVGAHRPQTGGLRRQLRLQHGDTLRRYFH